MQDVSTDQIAGDSQPLSITSIGTLRNALLPEGSLSAKFSTYAGPDLKLVSGTVYAGSRNGGEVRILWLKLNERLIPTGTLDIEMRSNIPKAKPSSVHVVDKPANRASASHTRCST